MSIISITPENIDTANPYFAQFLSTQMDFITLYPARISLSMAI